MFWTCCVLGAFALFVIVANVIVLVRGGALTVAAASDLSPAPVAIVLGASVRPDGTPSDALADRLAQAVELYRAGKVQKLLLSGDHGREHYDETNAMRRYVLERGVPSEDVFCDHAGFSTHDTMARARAVFGVTRAIVVTQRFHLARALYTASVLGIDAQGTPCDQRTYVKGAWFALREMGSRTKALIQSGILHASPRVLGEPISLDADGRASWDVDDER